MGRPDDNQDGLQELKITYEFSNPAVPGSGNTTVIHIVDTPTNIALAEAGAIRPGFALMQDRFQDMSKAKLLANNPKLAEFVDKYGR